MPTPAHAIDRVIDTFLGNPFVGDSPRPRKVFDDLSNLDVARELAGLLSSGHVEKAKLLALSVGHAQACRFPDDPDSVLPDDSIPASAQRRLPRKLWQYRRIATAAGRAYNALSRIRGTSAEMQRARRDTWAACFGDSLRHALELEPVIRDHDVLILGETGTGKEAFARAIQAATPGDKSGGAAPSAAINAAAIPDTLVESELFGHVKGSFTGATEDRSGRLRSADGGAFFLDEVGDLPSTTQVKLLRVIETDVVYPVGSDDPETADVRYVAATHKNLEGMTDRGEFRRDLFERLAGKVIRIPPLRDRPEDIYEIGLNFVRSYIGDADPSAAIVRFLEGTEARSYHWPGNVRELQNALRNLMLGLDPGLGHSAPELVARDTGGDVPEAIRNRSATMQTVEDWYLRAVVEATGGNLSQASRTLGIDRSTVRRRLTRGGS